MRLIAALAVLILADVAFADMVNIEGVDRAKLIQALYRRAKVQGMGNREFDRSELDLNEAHSLIGKKIDYLHGKVMKILIPSPAKGNQLHTFEYNLDNGENAVEYVVSALKYGNMSDSDVANEIPDLVLLRNGQAHPRIAVSDALRMIVPLAYSGDMLSVLALYELVIKSRNPHYLPPEEFAEILKHNHLLRADGSLPPAVKDVALSGAIGEGAEIRWYSPLAGVTEGKLLCAALLSVSAPAKKNEGG